MQNIIFFNQGFLFAQQLSQWKGIQVLLLIKYSAIYLHFLFICASDSSNTFSEKKHLILRNHKSTHYCIENFFKKLISSAGQYIFVQFTFNCFILTTCYAFKLVKKSTWFFSSLEYVYRNLFSVNSSIANS